VSLLMDALRRAEEAKRQAAGPSGSVAPLELRLDPLETPAPNPQRRTLPPLSSPLDTDAPGLATDATATPPSRPLPGLPPTDLGGSDTAARIAAGNVFAVKQIPRSRTALWLFLGFCGITMLAIGGYFWWQLQTISGGSLVRPTGSTLSASPPPIQPPEAPLQAAAETPLALPTIAVESSRAAPAPSPRAARPERLRGSATSSLPSEAAGVFRTGNRRLIQNQTLNQAYEAWQADRLDDARSGYEEVLRSDARNPDALLGLAAIAIRRSQFEHAQDLYLRVLESDPGDATAQAALINLRGQNDMGSSESRLKTLLASQPDSAVLHYALGNLYARQGRWRDAQQAYFQAYAADPDNADYIFNVAVSLDHLRQSKLAAQYYRMALSAAATRHGTFDRQAAEQRILELQP